MTDTTNVPLLSLSMAAALLACVIAFFLWRWFRQSTVKYPLAKVKFSDACRMLGLAGNSNLADEHDSIYDGPQIDRTTWKVKSLWVYPVKSCKGIELDNAVILGTGMEYDRQFAFARWTRVSKGDEELKMGWKFLTQRENPLLATIQSELWVPDPSLPEYSIEHPNVRSKGVIVIKCPTVGSGETKEVKFPYAPTTNDIRALGFRAEPMTIWKDCPDSILLASTDNHDGWIEEVREYLGVKTALGLFRVKDMHSRSLFRNAPRVDEVGYQPSVGFQDAYPLHIINLASVHDVASKCEGDESTLSAGNFRPNIIVTGGKAYDEDSWKRIWMGNQEYYTSCRTVRCLLPNVNQDTGKRHESEPNRTLKSFRKIDAGDPNNACLGMQMVPAVPNAAELRVGDDLTVLETGDHLYVKQ